MNEFASTSADSRKAATGAGLSLEHHVKRLLVDGHGDVFLATVDDRVSAASIEEMARNKIVLVVPESLKTSKEACYTGSDGVITFRDFFREQIGNRRPALLIT